MQNKPKPRAPDGEGNSLRIDFYPADLMEARALEMSQRLARVEKGARKRIIVTLLAAMQTHFERTGEIITTRQLDDLINSLEAKR